MSVYKRECFSEKLLLLPDLTLISEKKIPSNPDFFRNLNIMLLKCKESQTLRKVPLHAIIHL